MGVQIEIAWNWGFFGITLNINGLNPQGEPNNLYKSLIALDESTSHIFHLYLWYKSIVLTCFYVNFYAQNFVSCASFGKNWIMHWRVWIALIFHRIGWEIFWFWHGKFWENLTLIKYRNTDLCIYNVPAISLCIFITINFWYPAVLPPESEQGNNRQNTWKIVC